MKKRDVTLHIVNKINAMCVIWNCFPFSLDHQETRWQWGEHDLFYTCPPPLFLSHRWSKIEEDTITEKDSLMQIKKDTLRTQMYIFKNKVRELTQEWQASDYRVGTSFLCPSHKSWHSIHWWKERKRIQERKEGYSWEWIPYTIDNEKSGEKK